MTKNTTKNSQSKHTSSVTAILTSCTVVTGDHLWTRAGAAVMVEQLALLWLKRIQLGGLWTNQLTGLIRLSRNSQLETLNPVWGTRYELCHRDTYCASNVALNTPISLFTCRMNGWQTSKFFWYITQIVLTHYYSDWACIMKQERDFGTVYAENWIAFINNWWQHLQTIRFLKWKKQVAEWLCFVALSSALGQFSNLYYWNPNKRNIEIIMKMVLPAGKVFVHTSSVHLTALGYFIFLSYLPVKGRIIHVIRCDLRMCPFAWLRKSGLVIDL